MRQGKGNLNFTSSRSETKWNKRMHRLILHFWIKLELNFYLHKMVIKEAKSIYPRKLSRLYRMSSTTSTS